MCVDDVLLISASVRDLQFMSDCCNSIGDSLNIKFNVAKSKCIVIGSKILSSDLASMILDNRSLSWVDNIKYLGVTLLSGNYFKVDLSDVRRKFFVSVNIILSKCSYVSEPAKLKLMETHCLPILLYAIESMNFNPVLLKDINMWWNSVYRKIFKFNKWESVKCLICLLGRLDIYHLENVRRIKFLKNMSAIQSLNSVVSFVNSKYVNRGEFWSVINKFNMDFNWSYGKIKAMSHIYFQNIAVDSSV